MLMLMLARCYSMSTLHQSWLIRRVPGGLISVHPLVHVLVAASFMKQKGFK